MPLNEYFRQLGQTTPYPVSPLAQILRGIFAVRENRKQQAEQAEEKAYRKTVREAQAREMELQPLRERANFYLTQYQQDPRGAFKAAYEDNPEFRQLTQKLYGFQAPTVPTGIPGGPELQPAPGQGMESTALSDIQETFKLPGPPPPAFRSLGEMAAKFGLKLKPGVDANIAIDTLPRNININQLFVDPAEEREKEREGATARLKQLLGLYKIEQVFATPQLREPFLRDYQTVYGQPFPTRTVPGTTTRTVPQTVTTTPAITGTGPGLTRAGLPQTVRTGVTEEQRIPTGRTMEEPILPEDPKRITLAQYDPKFATTRLAGVPLPLTAAGTIDFEKVKDAYALVGVKLPQNEFDKRAAGFSELDRLYARVQASNTPEEARAAATAYNRHLKAILSQGINVPFEPIDTKAAMAGVARRTAQPREPKAAPGGLLGVLTLRAQGHMTGHPRIDAMSPQQAEALSRDPRINRPDFLEALGITLGAGGSAPPPSAPAVLPPRPPLRTETRAAIVRALTMALRRPPTEQEIKDFARQNGITIR